MSAVQRPLELILARNLMASLSTAALLCDQRGRLIFCNDAAAVLLGRSFEQASALGAALWEQVGPFDAAGRQVPLSELTLTAAAPAQSSQERPLRLCSWAGAVQDVQVSALPIVSAQGDRGALAFLWPYRDE